MRVQTSIIEYRRRVITVDARSLEDGEKESLRIAGGGIGDQRRHPDQTVSAKTFEVEWSNVLGRKDTEDYRTRIPTEGRDPAK